MLIEQKTQQISLALIRISVQARRPDLRQRLEYFAFQILEDLAMKNLEPLLIDIAVIKSLINFGKIIYQVEPMNAQILIQELANLDSAIRQIIGSDIDKAGISDIFSNQQPLLEIHHNKYEQNSGFDLGPNEPNVDHINNGNNGNGINTTIRQSAIIDKIRQSGKTALKNLLAVFPDVSERTLRYDLQKLCNQGVLDRIGNGGPATYYIART